MKEAAARLSEGFDGGLNPGRSFFMSGIPKPAGCRKGGYPPPCGTPPVYRKAYVFSKRNGRAGHLNHAAIARRFQSTMGAISTSVDSPQNTNPESPPTLSMTVPARKLPSGVEPWLSSE